MSSIARTFEDRHEHRADSPSANATNSMVFNENTKQWFVAVVMALSIATNIVIGTVLLHEYRAKEQSDDLKRYDLDFFKQNDWSDLKTRVMVNERLVNMLGRCPKG